MGLFSKKKDDPISERARALSEEIAALEAQIRALDSEKQPASTSRVPRLKSTAFPNGSETHRQSSQPRASEPIFEDVDQKLLKSKDEAVAKEQHLEHYNDLGVRKYDLAGLVARLKNNFHGPTTNNPKLVKLLAAGSVRGLSPMRYEKRVARNRFLFMTGVLLTVLLGFFLYIRYH